METSQLDCGKLPDAYWKIEAAPIDGSGRKSQRRLKKSDN
jgi:hypothetical protein